MNDSLQAPAAARLDRPRTARLALSGTDAGDFLHRMTSNDLTALGDGEGRPTLLLERSGRFVDRLLACRRADGWLVLGGPDRGAAVRAALEKYVIVEDVEIRDLRSETGLVTVLGTRATETLRDGLGVDAEALERFHHRAADVDGAPVRVVRAEDVGGRCFHVIFPEDARGAVEDRLGGAEPLDDAGWLALRVAWGVPEFGEEFDEGTVGLEAGMEDAISFTKGCYVGQEVIARVRHQGRVRRTLVRLRIDGDPPARGTALLAGDEETGAVRSAARLGGDVFALGYVRPESAEPGTELGLAGAVPGAAARVVRRTPGGGT